MHFYGQVLGILISLQHVYSIRTFVQENVLKWAKPEILEALHHRLIVAKLCTKLLYPATLQRI